LSVEEKPQQQAACAENFVKFGYVVFEMCEQTGRHADCSSTRPSWEQSNERTGARGWIQFGDFRHCSQSIV